MSALAELAEVLREEGGLLADAVAADVPPLQSPLAPDYAFVLEAVREGWRLHSQVGPARVVRTDDPDLALLAGDRLYALGVERLVTLGDLDSVALLADVIAQAARTLAEGRPQDAEPVFAACSERLSQAPDIRPH